MTGNNAHAIPWGDIPFFQALAQARSLSAAARQIGVDRTTVARRIDTLEARLARSLFDRGEGQFELTPFGRNVFASVERAEQELSGLSTGDSAKRHAKGKVRLTLTQQYSFSLIKSLARFAQKYPDILLEVVPTDTFVSLERFEADVALRLSRKPPEGLTALSLGYVDYRLYRSANADGSNNRYLTYPGREVIPPEIKQHIPEAEIVMSVDGFVAQREFVAEGVGIGLIPSDLGDRDPRLTPISPPLFGKEFQLWLVCLPQQKRLFRVNALMQFLRKELVK